MDLSVSAPAAILAVTRRRTRVPLKNISIINERNEYRFAIDQIKDPYSFKYMPDIIDVYPIEKNFNPGISMVMKF